MIVALSDIAARRAVVSADRSYDVAAAVVGKLAPEELPDLPAVWRAYWDRPITPDELVGRDHMLGGGADLILTWAPLVVAFLGTEVLAGAVVDESKDGLRRLFRRILGRHRRTAPPPLPSTFDAAQLRTIRRRAVETATRLGDGPERAELFADAVVGALATDSPTDTGPAAAG